MGSLTSHKLQPGKAKAKAKPNTILKHSHLRKIANLLRCVEFCVVLVGVSRLSIEYFRGFSGFMASPCFVFLLGNVIIITLFVQSGQFSAHGSSRDNPEHVLYQEFLQNSFINYKNNIIQADKTEHPQKQSIGGKTQDIKKTENIDGDGVKYQEKLSMRTENSTKGQRIEGSLVQYREKQSVKPGTKTEGRIKDQKIDGVAKITRTNMSLVVKDYRRCQSETLRNVQSEKPRGLLHRCESDNDRGSVEDAGPRRVAKITSYPEDGMSTDEFRRTIEAFIARQQRLRRQEQ